MPEDESKGTETQKVVEEQKKEEQKKQTVDPEAIREAMKREVEAAIAEKVRKEEKDKLYPEIEKLKGELKDKDLVLEEAQKAIKEYEEKNLTAEERTAKLLQELLGANENLKNQLDTVRVEAESRVKNMQLAAFKDKTVQSYKGQIIEGLVAGDSEEAIKASAEKAHEQYMEIYARVEKQKVEENLRTGVGTEINPGETNPKVKGIDVPDIYNITDPDEWAKVRKDILAKAGINT